MLLTIHFDKDFNIKEYEKQISFISSSITEYEIQKQTLRIQYDELQENSADLEVKIIRSMQQFVDSRCAGVPELLAECRHKINFTSHEEVLNGNYIIFYGDGSIVLRKEAVFLYEYFDSVFRKFAMKLGATEERYPVLLPVSTYSDTGYLRTSPQYSIFCCETTENMDILKQLRPVTEQVDKSLLNPSRYALSPSACFHVYEGYRGKILSDNCAVTLCQSVFRNEGRFNWKDFGRLRDYHVREIVWLGSPDYVISSRNKLMKMTAEYMKRIGLAGTLESSFDHFIVPQMQKFKKLQVKEKLKYEWRLPVGEQEYMAVASFNLHGNNFTHPFGIKIKGKDTVSGCAGFGLERMILSFFSQFGTEVSNWPDEVRAYCRKGR